MRSSPITSAQIMAGNPVTELDSNPFFDSWPFVKFQSRALMDLNDVIPSWHNNIIMYTTLKEFYECVLYGKVCGPIRQKSKNSKLNDENQRRIKSFKLTIGLDKTFVL